MPRGAIYPDLEGKTVIVTGGGSGIGASIVTHFARQKAKVGLIDINAEACGHLRST
jgi:NAD(P)-dependent dehydrogenase (short-subunit alcohol dehydrogenase family)